MTNAEANASSGQYFRAKGWPNWSYILPIIIYMPMFFDIAWRKLPRSFVLFGVLPAEILLVLLILVDVPKGYTVLPGLIKVERLFRTQRVHLKIIDIHKAQDSEWRRWGKFGSAANAVVVVTLSRKKVFSPADQDGFIEAVRRANPSVPPSSKPIMFATELD